MKRFVSIVALLAACGPQNGNPNSGGMNLSTNNGSMNGQSNGQTNGSTNSAQNGSTNGQTNNGSTNNSSGCALPAPFDAGATYDNEVRLDPGDDVAAALAAATPGTRVVLAAGQHNPGIFVSGVQGTAAQPIALVGEDGATIAGGSTGMQLSDPAFLVIENITIEGATANGLNIDDGGDYDTPANNVVLRDIVVRNIGDGGNQDCVKLSGLDDFHIEGIEVSGCSGQSIDMVGCHNGVITGNTLRDIPGSGVQAKGGSSDVLVHGNWFEGVAGRGVNAGGSTGLEFFRPIDAPHEGARIDVYSNVFVDVGETSGAPIAYVGCDACEFTNNTIVRPLTWVARILQETTDARFVASRDGVFANNVIVFDSGVLRTFVNVGPNTAPETFTFRNNLWWDLADPNFSGPSLGSGIPAATGSSVGNPGFDPVGEDFSIEPTSPAAGHGASAPNVPDYEGRCFADPPAAGAFER